MKRRGNGHDKKEKSRVGKRREKKRIKETKRRKGALLGREGKRREETEMGMMLILNLSDPDHPFQLYLIHLKLLV